MSTRLSKYISVDGVVLHYSEWGSQHRDVVLCVPGFSRNGRDFDLLADALADRKRVICVDLPGRGLSQWATDAESEYTYDRCEMQIGSLLAELGIGEFSWVGTSYGGRVGIYSAGGKLQSNVTRLVLNDVGPDILEADSRARIATYLGNPPSFPSMVGLENYYRQVYEPFGITRDDEWKTFTELSARRRDDGHMTPDYDPRAVVAAVLDNNDLWSRWDDVKANVLIMHGLSSDVLTAATITRMRERLANCTVFTVPECGHAPALNRPSQIGAIVEFLGA